jgi:hypothetical protein
MRAKTSLITILKRLFSPTFLKTKSYRPQHIVPTIIAIIYCFSFIFGFSCDYVIIGCTTMQAMQAALGNSKDYTLKQYLIFANKLQEKAKVLF